MFPITAFALPMMSATSPASQSEASQATTPKPTVFVAGATGNVGRRLVRQLAEAGCAVRAGSRDAQQFAEKVGDTTSFDGLVQHVPFDVCDQDGLARAVGDASVVVSAMGAPFSFGRVDGKGIADLMRSAGNMPDVAQLIVVSSIGVGRPWAFPAAVLNLFGGVLLFKDYSEQVVRKVATQQRKKYLIVRPGGMERPTDDFQLTHNLRLDVRNALAGGLVSNLQVADLIVAAVLNPEAADGKTIEAVAETDAPKLDYVTLLNNSKSD